MSSSIPRPESLSRSAQHPAPWVDTQPACFRSEGFAEDLHPAPVAQLRPQAPTWMAMLRSRLTAPATR
ncbi:MAG: hypothetical protein ABIN96_05310 [Rubrivivax sp.]